MAKRLTRYILLALVLGIIAGWAINAAIDDGTPASAARLKSIADYLSIVTALFLRLIKMIIAPLVFSTLVAGIAHMGDIAALGPGRRPLARLVHPRQPGLADPRPDAGQRAAARASASICRSRRRPRRAASKPPRSTSRISSRHLVPASIFEAMSSNEILPIVIFSLFFGVALTAIGETGQADRPRRRSAGQGDAPGHRLRDALRAVRGVHRGRPARSPSAARRSSPPSASSSAASISAWHPVGAADRRLPSSSSARARASSSATSATRSCSLSRPRRARPPTRARSRRSTGSACRRASPASSCRWAIRSTSTAR